MTKDMFPHLTEAVIQKLGTNSDLISNDALNKKWEMLTLVKIGTKSFFSFFYPRPNYTCYDLTLKTIIDENICLENKTEILVSDFNNFSLGNLRVGAGGDALGGHGEASGKNMESSSPINLMSEGIRQKDVEELNFRLNKIKVKQGTEEMFKLMKGERLAFVRQRVYNNNSVKFESKTSSKKTEVTTFTVPENKVFAFALKEITIKDGFLDIRPEYTTQAQSLKIADISLRGEGFTGSIRGQEVSQTKECHVFVDMLRNFASQLVDAIKNKGKVLEPLADLCGSTRRDLLKKLSEILEDREALALLEDTLDQCSDAEYQRPQSEAVASFMDLLDHSKVSRDVTEAVHLLVCALEALPDNTAALLARSGPETLKCITHMINDLKDGQAKLPESPPLPLQENEELHWVAKFIISANDLEGLKKTWGCPRFSPEGLLELLYISAGGLIMMSS